MPASFYFGEVVAAADLNGDGYSDLVTIAMIPTVPNPSGQFVFLIYPGDERGVPGTPITIDAPPDFGSIGGDLRLENAGDVNGDGYADILTAWSRGPDSHDREVGRAWLVAGHPSLPLHLWTTVPRPTSRVEFGSTLAGVGDLDGDGVADFAIRSDEEVSVYLGVAGTFNTHPLRTIQSPDDPCWVAMIGFGEAVGRAGDYNGDGRADLVIGSRCLPYTGHFDYGVGSVFVYQGQSAGVAAEPLVLRGMNPQTGFGIDVAGIGDFNQDGFGDLAVTQFESWLGDGGVYMPPVVFVLPGSAAGVSRVGAWTLGSNSTDSFFLGLAALSVFNQPMGG